jgi:hypothetical protein
MKENKIIAEFMGYETYEGVDKVCINLTENNGFSSDWGHVPTKYHTSWDWLISVANEIIKSRDEQNADWDLTDLKYALCTTNIEWVYKAVVEFINQYNK